MTITKQIRKTDKKKISEFPVYGILSAILLSLGVTIGVLIFKFLTTRDYTFENPNW